ncbi:MAG: hypothetical protein AB1295_00010 [Candidatus Micrarchaeota archaeon]
MQTIEAFLSLLVFLSISSLALASHPGPMPTDDSLYRLQLADDAWRVLYLRGDFQDLGPESRSMVEADLAFIGEQTGLCIFMRGMEFTNCRGGEERHVAVVSIKRTVIYRPSPTSWPEPLMVSFTLAR